jgi:hypothetical protein
MGFQLCRTLSVLVLAGVALVGCQNTPDKPGKPFGGGPLPGSGGVANQGAGQQFNGQQFTGQQSPGAPQAFPKAQQPATGGLTNPSPFSPAGGSPSNQTFGPTPLAPSVPTTPNFPQLPNTGSVRDVRTPAPSDFGTLPPSGGSIQAPDNFLKRQ